MKTKFILIAIFIIAFVSVKSQMIQPPNDTFQNWTVNPLAPDGWCTYSSIAGIDLGLSSKDVNAADSYFGLTSVKLISDSIGAEPTAGVVGGILSLGTGTLNTPPAAPSFAGIPFSYLPDTVYAIYQYSSPGADEPTAYILMTDIVADTTIDTTITAADTTYATIITKADTSINTTIVSPGDTTRDTIITLADTTIQTTITPADTTITVIPSLTIDTIISAGAYLPVPAGGFALGIFPITGYYLDANTPDTMMLQFCSSWETVLGTQITADTVTADSIVMDTTTVVVQAPVQGSTLILSQVFFGYVTLPTGLRQIADKMDFALFPNPTSNTLNISSADNATGFKVIISDMNGNLIYGGNLNGSKTSIAVQSFASGMYICRIADGAGNILKQDKFIVTK